MVAYTNPQPQELYFVKHETLVNYHKQLELKDIEIAELKRQIKFMAKMANEIADTNKAIKILTKEII